MPSVAAVLVENLLHGESRLAGGDALAQFRKPGQPGLAVGRGGGALRDAGQLGHRSPLVGDDYLFALLDHPEKLQQVSLCLFQRRRHTGI